MNDLEKHIQNLKKYCEDDRDFRSQTAEEEKSDFDIFCDNHIADIEAVLTAYEKEKEKNKKIIIFLKKDIRDCKNEAIQTKGNENNIGKLSGAKRRHIASMSGRENEAKRILNFLENKEE